MSVFNNITLGMQFMGICSPNSCVERVLSANFSIFVETHLNELYRKQNHQTDSSVAPFQNVRFFDPV